MKSLRSSPDQACETDSGIIWLTYPIKSFRRQTLINRNCVDFFSNMLRARNKVEQLDFKNTHYIQKILSCLVSDKLQRNWCLFVVIIVLSVRSTFSGQICPLIFSFRLKKYRSLDIPLMKLFLKSKYNHMFCVQICIPRL